MPTLTLVEGFNHGNVAWFANNVSGSPTVETTSPRIAGSRYAHFVSSAAASAVRYHSVGSGSSLIQLFGGFFRVASHSMVSEDRDIWWAGDSGNDQAATLSVVTTAGGAMSLKMTANGTGSTATGPSITTNTWYRFGCRAVMSAAGGNATIDWEIDGVSQTTLSTQASALVADLTRCRFGSIEATTMTIDWADMVWSETSVDYPIGEIIVRGLRANSTDLANVGGGVFKEQPANIAITTTAHQMLDENFDDSSPGDRIQQTVADAGYIEFGLEDSTDTTFHTVQGSLLYGSETNNTCRAGFEVRTSGGTVTGIRGTIASDARFDAATVQMVKALAITPPGGGWTQSEVNALVARFGGSTDASPVPYVSAFVLQYATIPAVVTGLRDVWGIIPI